jgi:predicted regulator of Ras-like GTPase activity (Roadblock/LC7/MglB family)
VESSALEGILKELDKIEGVGNIVLVSRSGMHIAGGVPKGAHTETFSAMFAILLGAAETATSEINENLDYVILNLENSRMLVINNGPKALLILRMNEKANALNIVEAVRKHSKKMEEHL